MHMLQSVAGAQRRTHRRRGIGKRDERETLALLP